MPEESIHDSIGARLSVGSSAVTSSIGVESVREIEDDPSSSGVMSASDRVVDEVSSLPIRLKSDSEAELSSVSMADGRTQETQVSQTRSRVIRRTPSVKPVKGRHRDEWLEQ
jgi:hypothetical protein